MSSQPRTADVAPESVHLSLEVTDPEVVHALLSVRDERARQELARTALRIGVLALEQARGRIDTDTLRHEGERLFEQLAGALESHRRDVADRVAGSLKEYFDPESGRFNDRVKRLVARDGDLEQVLRRLVGQQDSELARTLAASVGESSMIMRTLDPKAGDGVVASLGRAVEEQLRTQREHILREFSLDRPESALKRLVDQLSSRHGDLEKALRERIDEVVAEFSLDSDDSALSRLVSKVSVAQDQITREFSLDDETSALARLRGELLGLMKSQSDDSRAFHSEVKAALEGMKQRRETEARSTLHGNTFEAALHDALVHECNGSTDLVEAAGASPGLIARSKKGDVIITLGPDCRAAGARVVVEAKKSGSYTKKSALEELDEARRNRGASVGIFCWSRAHAPSGTPPLERFGDDVMVVWDHEDPATDVNLRAALSLARALCTKAATAREKQAADLESIEKAIRAIEKQCGALDEIRTSATTIAGGTQKILERVRIAQEDLRKQVSKLDDGLRDLREG
jgi:hypothetical protein